MHFNQPCLGTYDPKLSLVERQGSQTIPFDLSPVKDKTKSQEELEKPVATLKRKRTKTEDNMDDILEKKPSKVVKQNSFK